MTMEWAFVSCEPNEIYEKFTIEPTFLTLQLISRMEVLRTSSLVDRSWRGGVAGDAWLKRSGKTLFRVPRLLFSLPRF